MKSGDIATGVDGHIALLADVDLDLEVDFDTKEALREAKEAAQASQVLANEAKQAADKEAKHTAEVQLSLINI